MLDALSAAVRDGYRDVAVLKTDPDFTPFRAEPAFKALIEGLKLTTQLSG
jgi:hypothetical protein